MPTPVRFPRHFLPWDRPWLPQVAAWLAGDWRGGKALDLSTVLAVVPTRQSGRRLREALAEHAAARGAPVFPPRVYTPDTLLSAGAEGDGVATRLEALLAWTGVLRALEPDEMPDLLPQAPPRPDFAWALRLAEQFVRLQTQLTEGGLEFADVGRRVGADFPEAERWRQLALLEQRQLARLAAAGLLEPHAARRAFAAGPPLPPGVTRVVVLALPDPLPLAVDVWKRWGESVAVDVVVYAPPVESDAFDAAGRPVPERWVGRELVVPDFAGQVRLCADPAEEAAWGTRVASLYGPAPDGRLAFGIADPEVLPFLEHELTRAGIARYNPEGRSRRGEGLHVLLSALAALGREPAVEAVATLARCPDFLRCLQLRFGGEYSVARFLAELDDARTRHLPSDLAALSAAVESRQTHLRRALNVVDDLCDALRAPGFPAGAVAALEVVFRNRRFDLSHAADARAADAAGEWREVMRAVTVAAGRFPELSVAEWWDVALRLFGDSRRTEEKPAGALELQGWLELPWEDAPHLVVAGLNDGIVPDAVVGDAFLPESLRERLGLKTNSARLARDTYLLQAIAASRTGEAGRLDLLFAKTSAGGDPLRPSRLLLGCPDEELPARVKRLFRKAESGRPNLPWTRAWKISPRREPPPSRVAVTGLRAWMACPFRFYLQHVLKMEAVDVGKSELDARDFGTLCHTALEAMAREPSLRDCTDETVLREFVLGALDRAAQARLGSDLSLPLVIQLESARQRLGKAAAVQARERAAGWVIERVETSFSIEISVLEVRGKIHRIHRHESTGAWRVLDYKTSDTAVTPHKSHLRPLREADADLPGWMRVAWNGRDFVWADLQLPVYLRALARELGSDRLQTCGYINLPKAAGETDLALWDELDSGLFASALACTDGVAAAIRAGRFWPPAELGPDRDPFASLFHHGAEGSVAWPDAPEAGTP